MRNFITLDSFKQRAKSGDNLAEIALRKEFAVEVKAEDGDASRALTFTISTSSVDRHGDAVSVDGWALESYLKNPVVLWGHNYSLLPIGRAVKIWKHAGKLKAKAEFQPADRPVIGQLAEGVYQSYRDGFLAAVSVGFIPKKWNWAEDEGRKFGIDFTEQELLEFSSVSVPANAEALMEGKSAGTESLYPALPALSASVLRRIADEGLTDEILAECPEISDFADAVRRLIAPDATAEDIDHATEDPVIASAAVEVLKLRRRRLELA